jgi:hypothetical protein
LLLRDDARRKGGNIMMEETTRDMSTPNEEQLSQFLRWQAHKNEMIARNLSREAMGQWQKAINGVLALPTAIALSAAANTLYVAAFIERGFEAFQASAEAMGREFQNRAQNYMRSGNGDWGMGGQNRGQQQPQS